MDTRLLSAILTGVAVFFGLLALFPGKADDEPGLGRSDPRLARAPGRGSGRADRQGPPRARPPNPDRDHDRRAARARRARVAAVAARRPCRDRGRSAPAARLSRLSRPRRGSGSGRGCAADPAGDGQPGRRRAGPTPTSSPRPRRPPATAGCARTSRRRLPATTPPRSRRTSCSAFAVARPAGTCASCATRSPSRSAPSSQPPRRARSSPRSARRRERTARLRARRRPRAEASECRRRSSPIVIPALFLYLSAVNPELIGPVTSTALGQYVLLPAAVLLEITGIVLSWRVTRLEV